MERSELIDKHLDALLLEVTTLKDKLEHDREMAQQKKAKTLTTTAPPPATRPDKDATIKEQSKLIAEHVETIDSRDRTNGELQLEIERLRAELERT